MSFLDRSCKSESQKQLSCIIIAKLIPDLESVNFSDLTEMLQVVSDGVSRFEESNLDQTNAGKILCQYVKLKLKKQNIELMIKKQAKEKFAEFSKVPNDLDSKIEAISNLKEKLALMKRQLSLYNLYKRELRQLSQDEEAKRLVKVSELKLDHGAEINFVENVMRKICEAEKANSGT